MDKSCIMVAVFIFGLYLLFRPNPSPTTARVYKPFGTAITNNEPQWTTGVISVAKNIYDVSNMESRFHLYTKRDSFTNHLNNWRSVSNDGTNFLTISNRPYLVIRCADYSSFILVHYTDAEWQLITNYYNMGTNISTGAVSFIGPISRTPK